MSPRPTDETQPLPIDEVLPELVEQLRRRTAVVLTAPAGAGKSTRVPLALLAAGLLPEDAPRLLMLQPRRLAARAVARRMAHTLGESAGGTVGYQVRFERRASERTRVEVVTEGILTRRLLQDPLLEGVGCVILDELHERSVHVDLALALLRELQEVRPELRLVAMSATLDAAPVAAYLGGCDHVACEARTHPLTVTYHGRDELGRRPLEQQVHGALSTLMRGDHDDGGDLLVFLPGAAAILRTRAHLEEQGLPGDPELVPLYGALSAEDQDRVLMPAAGGGRRVILSTNIAETSLTVPRVTAVVDSGLVKRLRYDPGIGMDRLELGRVSRQSAEQRAGRAGRTSPGRARRLWTEADGAGLLRAETPELMRVDLAPALLALLAFSPGDPRRFAFFEPPPAASLEAGLALLRMLGAVREEDARVELTALGQRLAAYPLHPRVGALLEAARGEGLDAEGALLGALLGERDLLRRDAGPSPTVASDLLHRRDLFLQLERARFAKGRARALGIDPRAAHAIRQARDQLLRLAGAPGVPGEEVDEVDEARLLRLVLAGYPDRVCRRRQPGKPEAVMVGGRGVTLAESSGVREGELFVALRADAGRRGLHATSQVHVASAVDEAALDAAFPGLVATREEVLFDERQGAVVRRSTRRFADLTLAETQGTPPAERAAKLLAQAAAERLELVFCPDAAAEQLRARLRLAAAHLRDARAPWPDVGDEGLRALLPGLCQGRRSLDELRGVDWAAQLRGRLTHAQRALLDRELPARLRVPSGREHAVDYTRDPPVLAVKLQEVFGLADTPTVARGRVRLLLHLLAPNGRPVQVTQDLRSFWDRTYAAVRKDLRGRYPKHPWPEDPWSAPPTARTKKQKRGRS
jgi:ATP-dependent helicase HrpB